MIETKPEHRLFLLRRERVNISWVSCRIDDHVSVLQCFNCSGFGHVSKECKSAICCGRCAGNHLAKDCNAGDKLRCVNCVAAKNSTVDHAAYNKAKCPILRKKIERKILSVNYG